MVLSRGVGGKGRKVILTKAKSEESDDDDSAEESDESDEGRRPLRVSSS